MKSRSLSMNGFARATSVRWQDGGAATDAATLCRVTAPGKACMGSATIR